MRRSIRSSLEVSFNKRKDALATHITIMFHWNLHQLRMEQLAAFSTLGMLPIRFPAVVTPIFLLLEIDVTRKDGKCGPRHIWYCDNGNNSASLEIAKGDSFTPQVTWTIQHKNI